MPEQRMEREELDEQATGERRPDDERSAVGPATDPVSSLEQERDALQDRLLRTAAEFDNYRKRVDRERRELSQYAAADVLAEMLPIVDDLERALGAAETTETAAYRQGVELVHRKMLDLLRRRGVKPIDALGSDFDPNLHEAVVHEPSDRHREGEVMEEMRRGYLLGERLLRPAMVKVAKVS
ncbi:MAG: nucleotide exchange factor GrpE [Acidimicrobiia bacterium]|nr:nucleotide exchange factor GrpE [Acidimicrobiia bacterium]